MDARSVNLIFSFYTVTMVVERKSCPLMKVSAPKPVDLFLTFMALQRNTDSKNINFRCSVCLSVLQLFESTLSAVTCTDLSCLLGGGEKRECGGVQLVPPSPPINLDLYKAAAERVQSIENALVPVLPRVIPFPA